MTNKKKNCSNHIGDVVGARQQTSAAENIPEFNLNPEIEVNDTTVEWYSGVVYSRTLNVPESEDNGKVYVGNTMDEKQRTYSWNNTGNKSYGGSKIDKARKTYGVKNWDYKVLASVKGTSKEDVRAKLDELEAAYIEQFDSVNNGFNTSNGGTGQNGVVYDEERRKRNGDNRRGKPQSEETRAKISEALIGRQQSDETKAKISAGNTGKKRTEEQREAQSERMRGINPKAATEAAKKWREDNPGGWWASHLISDEMRANMSKSQLRRSTCVRATLDDGSCICFPAMDYAAKYFGMGAGSISNFIKTGNRSEKAKAKFEKITHAEYDAWLASNATNGSSQSAA